MTPRPPSKPQTGAPAPAFMEKHYAPQYWAKRWGISDSTVVRWFRDLAGVLRLGNPGRNGARTRVELRIPASVAERVYREKTGKLWG